MCLACQRRREQQAKTAAIAKKRGSAAHAVMELLINDKIKGSEWHTLKQMINSTEEDLVVAEEIIKLKSKN